MVATITAPVLSLPQSHVNDSEVLKDLRNALGKNPYGSTPGEYPAGCESLVQSEQGGYPLICGPRVRYPTVMVEVLPSPTRWPTQGQSHTDLNICVTPADGAGLPKVRLTLRRSSDDCSVQGPVPLVKEERRFRARFANLPITCDFHWIEVEECK